MYHLSQTVRYVLAWWLRDSGPSRSGPIPMGPNRGDNHKYTNRLHYLRYIYPGYDHGENSYFPFHVPRHGHERCEQPLYKLNELWLATTSSAQQSLQTGSDQLAHALYRRVYVSPDQLHQHL